MFALPQDVPQCFVKTPLLQVNNIMLIDKVYPSSSNACPTSVHRKGITLIFDIMDYPYPRFVKYRDHYAYVCTSALDKELAANCEVREPFPGYPHFAKRITSKDNVQIGDHILFQVTEPPFRPKFRSALVVDVGEHVEIIMNSEEGVVREVLPLHMMKKVHKIEYASQLHSEAKAIERAESRLKHGEKCYNVLKNNSHFLSLGALLAESIH